MKQSLFSTLIFFICLGTTLNAQFTPRGSNILYTNKNVGIGTNNPVARLDVNGAIHHSGSTILYNGSSASDRFKMKWTNRFDNVLGRDYLIFEKIDANGAYPDGGIAFLNKGRDGVEHYSLLINGLGNIGIGTTTPQNRLHILGNSGLRLAGDRTLEDKPNAFMLIQPDVDVSALNPGATTVSGRITNRRLGHLVLDIEANDSQDAFAIRTDRNLDGHVDHLAMVIKPAGGVGLGTKTPVGRLDVNGSISLGNMGNYDGSLRLFTKRLDATKGASSVTAGSGNQAWTLISRNLDSQWGQHGDLLFAYWNDSNWRTAMLIENQTGAVGIGTTSIPNGYKLAVNGRAIFEEVRVELSQNWPDYVFAADYDLMPLAEVEQSIKENGHLPGIPSAVEIEEQGGVELGEMQRKMMEKLEELTLYMIDLEKKNQHLQEEVERLKRK